jgi:hypothetical protein
LRLSPRKRVACYVIRLFGIPEDIASEFKEGPLMWEVVDRCDRRGLRKYDESVRICSRKRSVPSVFIDERIVFDNISHFGTLPEAV